MRVPNGKPGTVYSIKAFVDSAGYQGIIEEEMKYKLGEPGENPTRL